MIISTYFSHYPAYRNETCFVDLLRYVNGVLLEKGANSLLFLVNEGTPMSDLLAKFPHSISKGHIFAQPTKGREFPNMGKNLVYVEPAHI